MTGTARIRVDVDEPLEPDVEAGLLARLADGRALHLLAAIDVAAGEHPLAVAGIDGAPHQHDGARPPAAMIVPTATFGSM